METEDLISRLIPFAKRYWLPLTLGIAGLMLLGYGMIGLLGSSSGSKDIVFESGGPSNSASESGQITVDVEGAVVSPGVYNLSRESRIKDALIAGGGMSNKADRNWVSKNLNLALKLTDGGKIYIPFMGESLSQNSSNSKVEGSGLININTATEIELDSLAGVGPATASKIINGRPYQSAEELVAKKAVSSKVFENIKDKISIY